MDTCGFDQEFELLILRVQVWDVVFGFITKVLILRIEITKYGVRIIVPKNLQMFKTLPPYFQWNGNHGVTF